MAGSPRRFYRMKYLGLQGKLEVPACSGLRSRLVASMYNCWLCARVSSKKSFIYVYDTGIFVNFLSASSNKPVRTGNFSLHHCI
jgi:hypothetical protein